MAAPDYVPTRPGRPKYYESPPRRDDSWRAQRPGDLDDGHPDGEGLGKPGPDQGYALKLVHRFRDRVHLTDGERWEDASTGCVLVGLKRASLFGRAPVGPDLEIAFRIWGYLDEDAPAELVELRREAFDRVDNVAHHYVEGRRIVDAVRDDALRLTPAKVAEAHAADWAALIDIDLLADAGPGHDDD